MEIMRNVLCNSREMIRSKRQDKNINLFSDGYLEVVIGKCMILCHRNP